jgi:hypothetical protein
MRLHSKLAVLVLSVAAVAACQRETPAPASNATVAPAATIAAPATVAGAPTAAPAAAQVLWFEPAAIETCDTKGVAVTVHWNARTIAGVKTVEVKGIGPGGKESLFTRGGPRGERETGAWMTANRVMVLRDADNGNELARARMAGAACTK